MHVQLLQRRSLVTIALGFLAALLLIAPTSAGVSWCRSDPIVNLNGTEVRFDVAVPAEYVSLVNGPIEVKVQTPKGVTRGLIFTDPGFNGHGETVSFGDLAGAKVNANGSFKTNIQVKVPTTGGVTIPVMVDVFQGTGNLAHIEFGSSNATVFQITVQGTN